jgi:GntR family transcriptional regulator, arabinose operon transcriptional repressor
MAARTPKHRQIYAALRREIQSGALKPGRRLASEAALVKRFGASRITVGRAVRELQADGLVERHQGSGTYVKRPPPSALSFGLLIPDLGETEIFESICQGMMASPLAREHALIWGSPGGENASKEERAWQLCRQYIDRRVSGVFFAPLELTPRKDDVNARIADALDAARIPLVLLDRTVVPYPGRGHHDLVGIDNRRAGYAVTEHLLRLGCRRMAFVSLPHAAATIGAREAGYREALETWNVPGDRRFTRRLDPDNDDQVRELMASTHAEAIVCGNDRTAGALMHSLLRLHYAIPGDVRLVGIDDLDYAKLLPVPLTTLRQPTHQIGDAALGAMLNRVRRPGLAVRDILLECDLVVRQSCGAQREDADHDASG